MAWPVYSERFVEAPGVDGWAQWFVPSGRRAIVTHLSIVKAAGATGLVQLMVGGHYVYQKYFPDTAASETFVTKAVAYQGEPIQVYKSGVALYATVFGSLMTDDSGRAGPPQSGSSTKPTPPEGPAGGQPLP